MRSINAKKLIKILENNDFIFSRQKGSHIIFRNKENGIIVPVPLHGKSKVIPVGTLMAIIKQSKISKDKFE